MANFGADQTNYGIGECHQIDMLGRSVNGCHPDTASGYYLASDEAIAAMNEAGTNMCPEGMRPGRMVIKGIPATETTPEGYIATCGGAIRQEDIPDMKIVDWPYRALTDGVLVLALVVLLGGITLKLMK